MSAFAMEFVKSSYLRRSPCCLSISGLLIRNRCSTTTILKKATTASLEWYFHRRLLTQPMYESGCMFRRDFEIASVGRVTAVDWDLVFGSGQRDLTDVQLDAMRRINKAMRALSRRSAAMVLTICGAGLSAADYERAMKWKKGYGLEWLREGLNELAEHKGLITLN